APLTEAARKGRNGGKDRVAGVTGARRNSARSIDRAGWYCKSMKPDALHDAPEIRIDVTAHRRFNPAAFDPDIAERTIIQFAQGLDGLAARKIGDDAVHPASEQAEESARDALGRRLACRRIDRGHRTSPCFHAASRCRRRKRLRERLHLNGPIVCTPLSAISGLMVPK